jgi:hypothetical protein
MSLTDTVKPTASPAAASEPTLDERRHAAQRRFLAEDLDLEVGSVADCPLPLAQLVAVTGDEPWVVQHFGGGLTARVYRIRAGGRDWTLKRARRPALVKNFDGQTSFLNEIQRRADFVRLKAAGAMQAWPALAAIVDTTYASFAHGVLLSPWIEGEIVRTWDERRLRQLIDAAVACHAHGLFEWDLSPGNVLDDGTQVRLFDFGYMYPFDPLTQLNTAGHGTDVPMFHPVERFETRNLFGHLLELTRREGEAAALALFRLEKAIAVEAYERLIADLGARGARVEVLDALHDHVARWRAALAGDIGPLYLAEGWRSHVLDLADDLHGQTCTPTTLARADWLIDTLAHHHADLTAHDAFFGDDRGGDAATLLARYRARRRQAEGLQVVPA